VGNTTYYYEITEECGIIPAGTYYRTVYRKLTPGLLRTPPRVMLYHCSDRTWVQGPRGGVRMSKRHENPSGRYLTKNEQNMKEFMWIKLKAKQI